MKTFNHYYPINIPQGILFYPCVGLDIIDPLVLFSSNIKEFHFADLLPFPLSQLTNVSPISDIKTLNQTYIDEDIYQVNLRIHNRNITVYWHQNDAIKVLEKVNNISVFFYRGDSIAGGGSGIYWLGKDLFPKVLSKLVDGGLIVTDGSNPDENYKFHPWKELYLHSQLGHFSDNQVIKPSNFTYNNRYFTCLGPLGERYGTVYAWKVDVID